MDRHKVRPEKSGPSYLYITVLHPHLSSSELLALDGRRYWALFGGGYAYFASDAIT